jgi:hypothetical protein
MKTTAVCVRLQLSAAAHGTIECFCNFMHRRLRGHGHVAGRRCGERFEIHALVPSLGWMRDQVDELSGSLRARGLDHSVIIFPDRQGPPSKLEPMLSARLTRRLLRSCPMGTFLVSKAGLSAWAPFFAAELSDDDGRMEIWAEAARASVAQRGCLLFSSRTAWRDWLRGDLDHGSKSKGNV